MGKRTADLDYDDRYTGRTRLPQKNLMFSLDVPLPGTAGCLSHVGWVPKPPALLSAAVITGRVRPFSSNARPSWRRLVEGVGPPLCWETSPFPTSRAQVERGLHYTAPLPPSTSRVPFAHSRIRMPLLLPLPPSLSLLPLTPPLSIFQLTATHTSMLLHFPPPLPPASPPVDRRFACDSGPLNSLNFPPVVL